MAKITTNEGGLPLRIKAKRFIEEYLKDFNGTQAAIRAGYSAKTAGEIACENLKKPQIKAAIAARLEELNMTEDEIKKRFSDIARTDLSEYMTKRMVPFTPQVKVPLAQVIQEQREYVSREEEFCRRANLIGEDLEKALGNIANAQREILRLEIELERNPNAYRIVAGETIMVEEANLDLVKIINDKEKGKIKSIKHTKDGVQVEMYPADAALSNLARIRGMYVDKSEIDLNATVDTVVKVGYGEGDSDAG